MNCDKWKSCQFSNSARVLEIALSEGKHATRTELFLNHNNYGKKKKKNNKSLTKMSLSVANQHNKN